MDTRQLEKFAQAARRQLHEQVAARLDHVLNTDSAALRAQAKTVQALRDRVAASSREAVVETVAYTWFNRFCALRYMDVNHYTRMGTVSPAPGHTQPEILQEAKQGYLDPDLTRGVDAQAVADLLNGRTPSDDPQQEAYRRLLVGVCNAYHAVMPFMFETIDDYTELLMPDDLLSEGSILQAVRDALTPQACADVEVIGWLYQFYIAEKKDAVMGRRGKVPSEDIPAVTQLFTPHWIVRYMVENSLGRLWMLNHPDSRLVEQMDYYIAPEEERADCLRVASPEAIRLCDPAAGSGHILTYAFDLLYAIYAEEGYNPVDIPRLILEQNLTGIEIDARAGALAGFALLMKARERDARFFRRDIQPAICVLEDVAFAPDELEAYMDAVGHDLFTQDVQDWLQQFEQATVFGSLIRPLVTDTAFIRARLEEVGAFQNLFLSHTHDKLRKLLDMTEALSPRYHVVVANPPYMGGRNQPRELKRFLKDHYKDVKRDLFSAFVVRFSKLGIGYAHIGIMSPNVWMYLSSYEKLRKFLVNKKTLTNLVELPLSGFKGATVQICAYNFINARTSEMEGGYIRLVDFRGGDEEMAAYTREAIANPDCGWFYRTSASDFKKVPGAPIAYWTSRRVREIFANSEALGDFADIKTGMQTGDNSRFLRRWPEISIGEITLPSELRNRKRWFLYTKGGRFRKWYGNVEHVVDWKNDGYEIKNLRVNGSLRSRVREESNYFRKAASWSFISSSYFGCRYKEPGVFFDVAGSCALEKNIAIEKVLGFLCSKISPVLLNALNPTLNFQVEDISNLPFAFTNPDVELISCLIELSRIDWNSYETSFKFAYQPLLGKNPRHEILAASYSKLRTRWRNLTLEMQHLEQENNRIFIEAYGLEGELSPDVPLDEITLTCNPHYRYGSSRLKSRNWANLCERFPATCERLDAIALEMSPETPEEDRLGLEQRLLEDTIKEFISYAVGCMFGRYSLDQPGLILANQGETLQDYLRQIPDPTLTPDEDNVIPMLDGDWFTDDITARFKTFLRVTFGEAHYAENLAFIELALNRDIRGYFLRNFYADHVRTYSKRPIYWLFSSPNGSFNALVYMHRYRPDTVSVVLNDYLREFRAKLEARRQHLEHVERSAATPPREKTQAVKELTALAKTLKELRAYEDKVLYPLATQQVAIDLDDGVAVNYKKFGKALAHVRGLS